jgi:Protein of unknown function (DUF4197)
MNRRFAIGVVIGFVLWMPYGISDAGYQDLLKSAAKTLQGGQGLSDGEIVSGLKEALQVGTQNAVGLVSKMDGYYKNPQIKIPLPDSVQKVEGLLRAAGFGQKVDAFELSMNRAAEHAAPQAESIFWDAIKKMSFTDARKILSGPDNAATLYFKDKTSSQLSSIFKPIVHQSMSTVGVTEAYQNLEQGMKALPFGSSLGGDLDQYVTNKSLDGLFVMLAEEEKKIRQDPAARVTDLLRKVFAGN